MKEWIFLAPHFDDVVLSAGGLVWELVNRGEKVEIWTICAGDFLSGKSLPDYARMLHIFFELGEEDVPYRRSQEDAASCKVLGAGYRRYTMPDCIYRHLPGTDDPVIKVPDDIKGELEPDELYLIPPVTDFLRKNLPRGVRAGHPTHHWSPPRPCAGAKSSRAVGHSSLALCRLPLYHPGTVRPKGVDS